MNILIDALRDNGQLFISETGATIYITIVSTVFSYVLGIPLGILLVVTARDGLKPNAAVYKILDFAVNIIRSVPFLILMIAIIPLTRLIVGKSYGNEATIVPLVVSAAPYVARLVESSLMEVDRGVIEAAQSMGASNWTIIWRVMVTEARTSLIVGATIALATILGYSAMAGSLGGGGLGAIAYRFGYQRYQKEVLYVAIVLLVLLVQVMQAAGMWLSKRFDRRITA